MMTDKNYQEAVQVLRDHLGGRLEGVENEGRTEMAKILRAELGYDNQAADNAIDAMIKSGQLHYHQPILQPDTAPASQAAVDDAPVVPVVAIGAAGAVVPGGQPGTPLPAAGAFTPGYWQIGREDGGEFAGRAGQVTPH
jgi:hypothetical protein